MSGGRVLKTGLCTTAVLAVVGAGGLWQVAAAAASSTSAVQAVSAADRPLLVHVDSTRWFSPNGDGSQDKVKVGILLERPATVALVVRRAGQRAALRRVSLGRLRAGEQVAAWNGRNDRGRVVRDGTYRVTVVATSDRGRPRRERDATTVRLRTTYSQASSGAWAPQLELSRDTVHPTTRDFSDAVQIAASQRLMKRTPFGGGRSGPYSPAMEVRDADGRTVETWPGSVAQPIRQAAWAATTSSGTPLPAGDYRLAVHFKDRYGNTGRTTRSIRVSAAPLVVQDTWRTTVAAADALTSPPHWWASCGHDCMRACSPSASARTPDALTLRSVEALRAIDPTCQQSTGTFGARAPFMLGPLDRLSVTSSGSEHPSEGTGTALMELSSGWARAYAATSTGAPRTTAGPAFHGDWSRDEPSDMVRWTIHGSNLAATEYDLESFEVEVTRYTPAQ